MKKFQLFSLLLLMMAVMMPQTASAEYYGIKVGGVSVTSDNCDNITGSNIKRYSQNTTNGVYSDDDWYVRYDPSTKTLTLHDVLINRSGSNNRAILNESCDGLTIVFEMMNCLKARDASPVRLNANTTITSATGKYGYYQEISGSKEDGLTIGNGAKVFIKDIELSARGFNNSYWKDYSVGIVGATSMEELYINNAQILAYGKRGIENVRKVSIINSTVNVGSNDDGTAFVGLEELYLGVHMLIEDSDHISYNAEQKSFWDSSKGKLAKDVHFDSYVDIDEAHFPDAAFRSHVSETYDYNHDGKLAMKETYFIWYSSSIGYYYTQMDVADKGISSLEGLEYFPYLEKLDCSKNNLTSLDLSQFYNLKFLDCSYNQLTRLNVTRNSEPNHFPDLLYDLDCSHNQLTHLDLSQGVHSTLNCGYNLLTYLDFSNCSNWLKEIKMTGNRIDAFMNETLESLPEIPSNLTSTIYITSNGANDNVCTPEQAQIAKDKGWNVIIGGIDNEGNIVYDLTVGGSKITSANCDDLTVLPNVTKNCVDGYARYEAASSKLCLSGVDIVNEEGEGIKIEKGRPAIELGQDPVNITSKGTGILYDAFITDAATNALLTITSKEADWYSEKLNIVSQEDYAIKSCGKLTLMGVARVEAKTLGRNYPVYLSGNLIVKNDAELRIKPNGNYCSLYARELVLEDDNIVVTPEGATIPEGEHFLRDAKGNYVSGEVVIGKLRQYNYYVAGTKITNANQHAVLGDTTVVFLEPAYLGGPGTLVLNNANIEAGSEIGISAGKTFYLKLLGENNVSSTKSGLACKTAYIKGPGSLNISGQYGIDAHLSKLFISDGAKITAEGSTRYAIDGQETTISGKETVVKMKCSPDARGTFKASTSLTLEDGLMIEEPAGAQYVDGEIKDADGNVIKDEWVTIQYTEAYDITVAGIGITNHNMNDVLGDGTVSFDPETNTLTLDGANIETTRDIGLLAKRADLKVNLIGENTIRTSEVPGLQFRKASEDGPVTFMGGGSLNVTSDVIGMQLYIDAVLTDGVQVTVESTSDTYAALQGRQSGQGFPRVTMSGTETMLKAKGGALGSIANFSALVLNDGLTIGLPTGATLVENVGVVVDGTLVANEWVIIASQDYIDGVQTLSSSPLKGEGIYNLAGQKVGNGYKGIVIIGNKKYLRK